MNEIINNFQIIVARYNEDIQWLKKFKSITLIYNKGKLDNQLNEFNVIQLPNYGRESHTYLYHIINNYDNLKEFTIFFQGSLDFSNEIKHSNLNIEDYFQMNNFNANLKQIDFDDLKIPIKHFGKWKHEYDTGLMRKSDYTCYKWLKSLLNFEDHNIDQINVAWGAIFSVKKSCILKKPKIFYENLLRYIDYHPNPEEGHFFERTWYFIFHNDYIKKKKINVIKFHHTELNKIEFDNSNIFHYWINLNEYNKYNNILNDIIIYPNFYFKINKYSFNFKFNHGFYIKFILNDTNTLVLVLTPNLENNFVVLNNDIIKNVKNNIKNDYNNFNFIIENNILKIFINYDLYFEHNIEKYNIEDINNIPIYIKTNNYNNNIKFNNINKNNDNQKFIIYENNYYDIKCFYTNNFLNYFIDYIKH